MNYKYIIKHDVATQLPTWVVLELWELLSKLNQDKGNLEIEQEDIEELTAILTNKVNAIQSATEYQRTRFGKSKYDL